MFVDLAPRCVKCATMLTRARRREAFAVRCTFVLAIIGLELCTALSRSMERAEPAYSPPVGIRVSNDLSCDAPLDDSLSDDELDALRVRCEKSDRLLFTAAQVYRRNHQWRDAILVLRRLGTRRPDEAVVQVQLAEAYEAVHDKLLAAGMYTWLLHDFGNLRGLRTPVALHLTELYLSIGRPDLATRVYKWLDGQETRPLSRMSLPDPFRVWPDDAR